MSKHYRLIAYLWLLGWLCLFGMAVAGWGSKIGVHSWWRDDTALNNLLQKSIRNECLSYVDTKSSLSGREVYEALRYINSHQDHTSFHLLFALRTHHRRLYDGISPETRAAVLCSTLQVRKVVNDWGVLSPDEAYDDEPARALLESGQAAIPRLLPLLDDDKRLVVVGSKESTLCFVYHYRTSDFAYRYLCLLINIPPVFHADPRERDKEIQHLKQKVFELRR